MKVILEGVLISSKTGSLVGSKAPMIQAVPVRYVEPGLTSQAHTIKDDIDITIFIRKDEEQCSISIPIEEWDNFVGNVREEIERINNFLVISKD